MACVVHPGLMPAESQWYVTTVAAPVAEADIDATLRSAVVQALGARDAWAEAGAPVALTILAADWAPAARTTTGLAYEARLRVEAVTPTSRRTFYAVRVVAAPPTAALAAAAREDALRAAADEVALALAGWLAAGAPGG